uniref:Uncharacterized protein n=1 Tax=Amphimedon queenslandica TaxID=400682 RepID=A0A1X7VL46_AMPQE
MENRDHILKCPFHTSGYKLQCKVTTDPAEPSHNVLVRYTSKNWNLARLYYHVSTNI